jgi:hypothetical protein
MLNLIRSESVFYHRRVLAVSFKMEGEQFHYYKKVRSLNKHNQQR